MSSTTTTTPKATEAMLNHSLFDEEQQVQIIPTQMGLGFLPFLPNMTFPLPPILGGHQSFKPLTDPPSLASHDTPSDTSNLTETLLPSNVPGEDILSLHRSTPNIWAWGSEVSECLNNMGRRNGGEDHHHHHHHFGVSPMRMKKKASRRKVREPRFCFKTMSDVDVLDDGYKWRKYGQKVVKNTQHPRSYYRCTQDNCRVKKRVERLAEDPRMVITTYEGRHIHSPSHDTDDSQSPTRLNNFFW